MKLINCPLINVVAKAVILIGLLVGGRRNRAGVVVSAATTPEQTASKVDGVLLPAM